MYCRWLSLRIDFTLFMVDNRSSKIERVDFQNNLTLSKGHTQLPLGW